jgi:micrococcal nuclease
MDTDRYGRSVANVLIDGKGLNEKVVKAGYAWVYTQYCKTAVCQKWYQYEAEARAQKIGLWSISREKFFTVFLLRDW